MKKSVEAKDALETPAKGQIERAIGPTPLAGRGLKTLLLSKKLGGFSKSRILDARASILVFIGVAWLETPVGKQTKKGIHMPSIPKSIRRCGAGCKENSTGHIATGKRREATMPMAVP